MFPVVLIGFMGSGKSAVARRLARMLHRRALDLDAMIEHDARCSIPHLFATQGEAAFRARETDALRHALTGHAVVATGGGIVTREENLALLQNAAQNGAQIVYLRARPETLAKRIRRQPGTRPLIDGQGAPLDLPTTQARVEELLAQREQSYEHAATLSIDTDALDAYGVARLLARQLRCH